MAPDAIERISALKDPALLRQQCYVDGNWCDADNGATRPVVNPATGQPIGTAPLFGATEFDPSKEKDGPSVRLFSRDRKEITGSGSYAVTPQISVYGAIARTIATLEENGAGTSLVGGVSFFVAAPRK